MLLLIIINNNPLLLLRDVDVFKVGIEYSCAGKASRKGKFPNVAMRNNWQSKVPEGEWREFRFLFISSLLKSKTCLSGL